MPVRYGFRVADPVCTMADAEFFSMLARDDGCKGLLQICNRYRGKDHEASAKIDTVAQTAPVKLLDTLHDLMLRKSRVDSRWLVYGDTDEDTYCTINTMQPVQSLRGKGVRNAVRCVELRMLYWDIDAHGSTVRPGEVVYEIIEAIERGALPPMAIVNTGRGCGLYIPLRPEDAQNKAALKAYRGVAEAVYALLVGIISPLAAYDQAVEVDRAVVGDVTRIARLPGTANTVACVRCHAVEGYAYTQAVDLFALADYLGVDYDTEREAAAEAARKERARLLQAQDIVARYTHRNVRVKAASRAETVLAYLRLHSLSVGNRHKALIKAGSTLHDQGAPFDPAAMREMAACCAEPLPEREVEALVSWVQSHPDVHFRAVTIEDALQMPRGMLGRSATDGGDLISIDLAAGISSAQYMWAVGYLIDHDPHFKCDTRRQNRTRDDARARNKAAKARAKEKARQMLAGGMSVRNVASETGLSLGTISALRKELDLD